jgi:hypothetical protein
MTVVIDEALRELAESYRTNNMEEPLIEAEREITWEELCEYRKLLHELNYMKALAKLEKIKRMSKEKFSSIQEWEEVDDYRILLNKIDMEKHGKGRS